MIKNQIRKKDCPNCEANFQCASENCWCCTLPNIMPFQENEKCLCPQCLQNVIKKKQQERKVSI